MKEIGTEYDPPTTLTLRSVDDKKEGQTSNTSAIEESKKFLDTQMMQP